MEDGGDGPHRGDKARAAAAAGSLGGVRAVAGRSEAPWPDEGLTLR